MKLAVGFFDGVHLGHRAVLAGADAALTFTAHPLFVLAPERAPPLLMPVEARLAELRKTVRRVEALAFTRELANEAPAAFVARLKGLFPDVDAVRCGANWRFGRGGAGDAAFLRSRGLAVEVARYVVWQGEPVSSTRIRAALAKGEVGDAAAMLGRPYAICGGVVSGKGLGRRIGFPTLNVLPDEPPPLRFGVYAVETPLGRGVANWGVAPTLGAEAWARPVVEVHLEAPPPERPSLLEVEFRRFLRGERPFDSLEALASQLARDREDAVGGAH